MKKKIIFGILACTILTVGIFAYANPKISIVINGTEINTDNIKNEDGSVTAHVRTIAEALNAVVKWDSATQSVIINKDIDKTQEQRIELLEQALVPKDSLSAVKTWAEAIKLRNGALQYAVLSKELKITKKDEYADMFWTTGTSSPWVSSYDITEKAKYDDNTYLYRVVFIYTDSTKNTTQTVQNVSVKNFQDSWLISEIEKVEAIGEITEIKINNDESVSGIFIENKSELVSGYDKANVIITGNTKIYDAYTNNLIPAKDLKTGAKVEVTFVEGPRIMIYPLSAEATIIRVID